MWSWLENILINHKKEIGIVIDVIEFLILIPCFLLLLCVFDDICKVINKVFKFFKSTKNKSNNDSNRQQQIN